MEGQTIQFFVTFEEARACITISEYETVEMLKIAIDDHLKIPVPRQRISGWNKDPQNDHTILKVCSNPDFQILKVTMESAESCVESGNDFRDDSNMEEKCNNTIELHAGTDDIDYQINAIKRLRSKISIDIPVNLRYVSLDNAISFARSAPKGERIALLFYLHNSSDSFSQSFLEYIKERELHEIINNFFFLGWDIEEPSYQEVLISAFRDHEDLSFVTHLITKRKAAVICILPDSMDLPVFFCLQGNVSYGKLLKTFRNAQESLKPIETNNENDSCSYPSEDQDYQINAIKSLRHKISIDIPVNLQYVSLDNAISFVRSAPQDERIALLLYLHNSSDPFSQSFLEYLKERELHEIINNFFFLGWDIEDPSYQEVLISAFKDHVDLSCVMPLITKRKAAVICILPDSTDLTVFFCLRESVSYEQLLESFHNAQESLKPMKKNYKNDSCSYPSEDQDEESKRIEEKATESLKRKLVHNNSITFRKCSLDDAIRFITTAPLNERKALLLYLHNMADPFSKLFCEGLKNNEVTNILNRSFIVLGWDVEEASYHDALISALNHHVNLSIVSHLVSNQVAVGLCVLPVADNISVVLCLRGKMSINDMIKGLKGVETEFTKEMEKEAEVIQLENEKSNQNDMGSEKLQSLFADMLGDRDYDSFEYNEHDHLKTKIGFALKGPPQKLEGYEEKDKKNIELIYKVIAQQSNLICQYRDKIEISFVYNCTEPLPEEKLKRSKKFEDYNPKTDVNPIPIFILRKCQGSNNPCRIFIDSSGRVYQTWQEYLTRNKLDECEMILPLNGRYTVINDIVLLEKHLSPACHLDTKLLQVGDIVGTAVGLVSGGIFVAAAIPAIPVAVPLLIAGSVAGAVAGIWAIGRSAHTLYDRKKHRQSMSFANSEARGAYLNIVAGSLGFVGAGANMAVGQLAARGVNIGQGAKLAVNSIGAINIGASGVSLFNSGYDVIDQWVNENQTPSALTILQLSTSVLFFGHALYNFKSATTIVEETQARVLQDYQESLRSNRHRKVFSKLMKETLRNNGDNSRGRAEVISAIRNIPNKDDVFAALTRHNKNMNKNDVRFSADGGQIKLNGMNINMNEFIGFNKKEAQTFLNNLSQQNTPQQPVATANPTTSFVNAAKSLLNDLHFDTSGSNVWNLVSFASELLKFCTGDTKTLVLQAVHQAIKFVLSKLAKPIVDALDEMLPKNSQYFQLIHLGIGFFSRKVKEFEERYQRWQKTHDPTYYLPLFEHINPLYAKRACKFFEFVVRVSFNGDMLIKEVLNEIASYVTGWISKLIFENEENKDRELRRKKHSAEYMTKEVPCKVCGGTNFVSIK